MTLRPSGLADLALFMARPLYLPRGEPASTLSGMIRRPPKDGGFEVIAV